MFSRNNQSLLLPLLNLSLKNNISTCIQAWTQNRLLRACREIFGSNVFRPKLIQKTVRGECGDFCFHMVWHGSTQCRQVVNVPRIYRHCCCFAAPVVVLMNAYAHKKEVYHSTRHRGIFPTNWIMRYDFHTKPSTFYIRDLMNKMPRYQQTW